MPEKPEYFLKKSSAGKALFLLIFTIVVIIIMFSVSRHLRQTTVADKKLSFYDEKLIFAYDQTFENKGGGLKKRKLSFLPFELKTGNFEQEGPTELEIPAQARALYTLDEDLSRFNKVSVSNLPVFITINFTDVENYQLFVIRADYNKGKLKAEKWLLRQYGNISPIISDFSPDGKQALFNNGVVMDIYTGKLNKNFIELSVNPDNSNNVPSFFGAVFSDNDAIFTQGTQESTNESSCDNVLYQINGRSKDVKSVVFGECANHLPYRNDFLSPMYVSHKDNCLYFISQFGNEGAYQTWLCKWIYKTTDCKKVVKLSSFSEKPLFSENSGIFEPNPDKSSPYLLIRHKGTFLVNTEKETIENLSIRKHTWVLGWSPDGKKLGFITDCEPDNTSGKKNFLFTTREILSGENKEIPISVEKGWIDIFWVQ